MISLSPRKSLSKLVELCIECSVEFDERLALDRRAQLKGDERDTSALDALEAEWWLGVDTGEIAWRVYESPAYLAELWACWAVYSRAYLKRLDQSDVRAVLGDVNSIVDLGCGIGFSTAAFREMFPDALVLGTDIEGSPQHEIATRVQGFDVVRLDDLLQPFDIVFASEYLEHFERPLEHLVEIVERLNPRVLVEASTFGPRAIGHFELYLIDEVRVEARLAARAVRGELTRRGYVRADVKMWNNRPAIWLRT